MRMAPRNRSQGQINSRIDQLHLPLSETESIVIHSPVNFARMI